MLFREARRIFPPKVPAVNPLMIAEIPCLCAPDSLLCRHDCCHIRTRHWAPQWRRRSPGLRRCLAAGRRYAPLLPRPCRNRCPDPVGSAAVASCTSATGPLRRVWRKQPSEVTTQVTLHHNKNTSISGSRTDPVLSLRAWTETFPFDVTLVHVQSVAAPPPFAVCMFVPAAVSMRRLPTQGSVRDIQL